MHRSFNIDEHLTEQHWQPVFLFSKPLRHSWPFRSLKIWNFIKPTWRRPPSWKFEKKSRYLGRGSSDLEIIWHGYAVRRSSLTVPNVKNFKFWKSKMAATAILKIEKSPYFGRSPSDFDEIWHTDHDWCTLTFLTFSIVKNLKFQKFNMATSAILRNRKIAISRSRLERLRQNLARLGSSTLLTVPSVKSFQF